MKSPWSAIEKRDGGLFVQPAFLLTFAFGISCSAKGKRNGDFIIIKLFFLNIELAVLFAVYWAFSHFFLLVVTAVSLLCFPTTAEKLGEKSV